jgi:hypothetical protein
MMHAAGRSRTIPAQSGDVLKLRESEVAENLVGRDGIEPLTPGFSDLSLGIANDAEVLVS